MYRYVALKFRYILLLLIVMTTGRGCASHTPSRTSIATTTCDNPYTKHIRNLPGTPNIRVETSCGDYTFTDKKLVLAISMFVQEYSREFNMDEKDVWKLLSSLRIELSAIPRTVSGVYDINGNPIVDAYVTGLALSKDHIWVEIKTSQIWSSSLAHELVHIIIWRSNQIHGDPDHEGPEFSGWTPKHTQFIKRFNLDLLDLEI